MTTIIYCYDYIFFSLNNSSFPCRFMCSFDKGNPDDICHLIRALSDEIQYLRSYTMYQQS